MSETDRSVEHRVRLLSRARVPRVVALNQDAPLYMHRMRLLACYGLQDTRFFTLHLYQIEQSGRAKALGQCDVLDRVAVTDPSMSQVTLVRIEPPGHAETHSRNRHYKDEEEQHAT